MCAEPWCPPTPTPTCHFVDLLVASPPLFQDSGLGRRSRTSVSSLAPKTPQLQGGGGAGMACPPGQGHNLPGCGGNAPCLATNKNFLFAHRARRVVTSLFLLLLPCPDLGPETSWLYFLPPHLAAQCPLLGGVVPEWVPSTSAPPPHTHAWPGVSGPAARASCKVLRRK